MEVNFIWNSLIAAGITVFIFYYLYKSYIFPVLLNSTMKLIHASIRDNIKKKVFKEAFDRVKSNEQNAPLQILEIGVGTGENFMLYPQNSKISFVDKTDVFMPFLRESLEKDGRRDLKLIVTQGEDMVEIESNSQDVVVHTFILCSVVDPARVLKEIYRVLKPGGVCVFIEHSLDNREFSARKVFQKIVGPVWHCLFDCRNFLNSFLFNFKSFH